ncbi:hypothetical protein N0M98_16200, partial [Paenibacillus doosanensis]|uniref:hypothetical protein n=1 Tax=Paenibacillus doosanensis TaxID=1229154 RepID=UPI00217F7082
ASHEPRKETPGSLFAFFAMALVDPLIPLTRDAVNCDPFSKPYVKIDVLPIIAYKRREIP